MMRDAALGLVAGAAAVLAIVLTRPVPAPPPTPVLIVAPGTAIPKPSGATVLRQDRIQNMIVVGQWRLKRPDPQDPLQTVIPEINVQNASLEDVIQYVADLTGAPLELDREGVEERFQRKAITMHRKNARAADILHDAAEMEAPELGVVIVADDGKIVVGGSRVLQRYTMTRIYPIHDLMLQAAAVERGFATRETLSGELFSDTYSGAGSEEEAASVLADFIQTTVHPHSWREAGGVVGTTRYWGGNLMIHQTPAAHEEIEDFLAQLREHLAVTATTRPTNTP